MPDESAILRFRNLLDTHVLGDALFAELNHHLAEQGWVLSGGTIVDAAILDAPTSTKNQRHARDSERQSTKKGNRWPCGMKIHIGVDAESGLVQRLQATAALVHDLQQLAPHLLHGQECTVCGNAGYLGCAQRPELRGPCLGLADGSPA